MGEPVFHGIGGTVKNNHVRFGIRQSLRRFGERFFQLAQWFAPLAGHAKPGNVNACAGRCVLVELRLGQPITGRNDQTNACWGIHRSTTFSFWLPKVRSESFAMTLISTNFVFFVKDLLKDPIPWQKSVGKTRKLRLAEKRPLTANIIEHAVVIGQSPKRIRHWKS